MSSRCVMLLAVCFVVLSVNTGTQAAPDSKHRSSDRQITSQPSDDHFGRRGGRDEHRREWDGDRKAGEHHRPDGSDGRDRRGPEGPRGFGDRRRPPGPHKGMWKPYDDQDDIDFDSHPEELDRLLKFTQKNFPPVYDRLIQTRKDDPRAFRFMLKRFGPPMIRLMRMAKEDPEDAQRVIRIQKLEMRMHDVREKFRRAASQEQREKLRAEMRGLVEQRFEVFQQRLQAGLDDLSRQLDKETQRYNDRVQRKQQIIDSETVKAFERKHHGPHRWEPESAPAEQ